MIPLFKVFIPKGMGSKIEDLFNTGFVSEGVYSDEFENKFSERVGNPNCSLVNTGTSALTLAYKLCDIQQGDEVLVTPMTCMATNVPALLFGAKLVWVDVDPKTGNIDPEDMKKKITSKTKAVCAVHWAGQPFDIDAVNTIAKEHGIKVIEDAAHAMDATYNGKKIGNHSDFVMFSFQAIKHMTTVDGGALMCNTEEDAQKARLLRWYCLDRKYTEKTGKSKWEQDISDVGFKFHMNNLNALIGLEQLKNIDYITQSHIQNGRLYDREINNPKLTKLARCSKSQSSYWIYSILVNDREDFKKYLHENGIASDVVHVRNDDYTVFKDFKSTSPLAGCDEFCSKMINIPVGWWLTKQDKERIIEVCNRY
jgi:dTDP-4-amino-4,6-dideoxygalactose transaminase